MSARRLRPDERRTLVLLGLPTAALALAITFVTTYVPVVADRFLDSTTVIGLLIGLEGVIALWLPIVVGRWSDELGRRLPFLAWATPVAALSLVAIGLSGSFAPLALAVVLFFLAYFVAYEPYRALYPDLMADEIAARAQGTQAVWRGLGTGLALVGGGMLVAIGTDVAFFAAAAIFAAAMVAFLGPALRMARGRRTETAGADPATLRALLRARPVLRSYFAANACWEASLGALKTFVFLYVIQGLDRSKPAAAGIIGGVALLVVLAAPLTGKLADRYGRSRVLAATLPFYGVGLLVPAFTQSIAILVPVMVVVGFGGAMVMSLPYALLQPLMPHGQHGLLTGFYSVSRGIGTAIGPAAAGIAIETLHGPFGSTDGYAAMWLVCGGTILLSLPFLLALRRREGPGGP